MPLLYVERDGFNALLTNNSKESYCYYSSLHWLLVQRQRRNKGET